MRRTEKTVESRVKISIKGLKKFIHSDSVTSKQKVKILAMAVTQKRKRDITAAVMLL